MGFEPTTFCMASEAPRIPVSAITLQIPKIQRRPTSPHSPDIGPSQGGLGTERRLVPIQRLPREGPAERRAGRRPTARYCSPACQRAAHGRHAAAA